jgi:pimeloyl-ACP methyl ester carboxylesterase
VRVHGFDGATVRLSRTPDLNRPIPLGFAWPGGHARLGAILGGDRSTVTRAVTAVDRGTLRPGIKGYSLGRLFEGDPTTARGLPYTEVIIDSELGGLPAWFVPPTAPAADTWVIMVHGWRSDRTDALRMLPALAAAGFPTLTVTYRNDAGAPPSHDRCYHLGATEWLDLAAAVSYAVERGARNVVLYGWSMGGAIVLNLLHRAAEAGVTDVIRAAVLDCPVVDWGETLRTHAKALNVPPPWTWTALRLVQRRLGAQLAELDQRRHTDELKVPVLMYVDLDDTTVAPGPALQYAAARPDLVTLVETEDAGHCRAWNLDPDRYEAGVTAFLTGLG